MNTYTSFTGTILVPVQVVQLKFAEKEDRSLNSFQNLILEAIEMGCGLEQIVQATLLKEHVIEAELEQLISQKLLKRQGGVIGLTPDSQKLLLVSRCVQRLNEEKRLVCINLMTGAVEEYDKNCLAEGGGSDALELQPKVRKQEIDGISMEENIEFFQTFLRTFDAMEPEQVDQVLSAVYVEFIDTGERRFRMRPISRIPCLIGDEDAEEESGNGSAVILARGHMCRMEFSLKSAMPGVDGALLLRLPALAEAGLLSDKGMELTDRVKAWQKAGGAAAYYDCVSRRIRFQDAPGTDSGRHRVDLELPVCKALTETEWKRIAQLVCDRLGFPPELALEATCTEDTYIVSGELDKMWEADHG